MDERGMRGIRRRSRGRGIVFGVLGAGFLMSCGVTIKERETPTPEPEPVTTPTPEVDDFTPGFDTSILVEPTVLNFGSVELSTSKTMTVGYFNTGDTVYDVKYVELYSPIPYFAVAEISEQQLLPGDDLQIDVTFRPAQTGTFGATLNLVTEQGGVPWVTLAGIGVPASGDDDSPTPEESPTPGP